MSKIVSPAELHARLRGDNEIALLDVREEGVFAKRHLLRAAPMPLSRLETRLPTLVPRRGTPVVLCDDGDGLAARAAAKMARFGYGEVALLDGGVAGWAEAGYMLFGGVHVPSKAFGEFVEQAYETPRIEARDLDRRRAAGDDLVILDSRPMAEYRRMNIPGGIDVPGAELAYRVHDVAPRPETTVIVNCAGRTRSIIGAQSLINAGIANPVMALKDGTMGWHLAGLDLERGQSRRAPAVSPEGLARARAAAARVARRFGVRTIDRDGLARLEAEADRRGLYLFDVRDPDEYAAGHLPGSRSAPGGQLVQATDTYVGAWNTRLVLVDDSGVRATMTASWLIQMGWREVYVLAEGLDGATLVGGAAATPVLGLDACEAETITVETLARMLDAGAAVVVDLDDSLAYRAGHIPGAWFAVRSRLDAALAKLPAKGDLVFASQDGVIARLAAADMTATSGRPTLALDGGTDAWRAAGLALEEGESRMAAATDDVWYKPYDHAAGVEDQMRAYLSWEVDLVHQIARDGTLSFARFPD